MAIELLSESPIFHAMALDVVADDNEALPDLTAQFVNYLNGTMHEMWMGDPHAPKPGREMKALPATGSMTAITAHGELDLDPVQVQGDDQVVVKDNYWVGRPNVRVHDSVIIEDATVDDVAEAMRMLDDVDWPQPGMSMPDDTVSISPVDVTSTQVFDVPERDVPTVTINVQPPKPVRRTTRAPRSKRG